MTLFESLESRRLLAVTAGVIAGDLVVAGDAGPNGISVEQVGLNLVVKTWQGAAGYQPIYSVFAAGVHTVRVYGYDGPDTLQVHDNVTRPAVLMGGRGADWLKAGGGLAAVYGHGDWFADPTGSHNALNDDNAADTLVTGNGLGWNQFYGGGGDDSFHTVVKQFIPQQLGGITMDAMAGEGGNDTFYLSGNRVADVHGGPGNDRFVMGPENQPANLGGNSGYDTVDYSAFGQAVYVKPEITTASGPRAPGGGERHHWIWNHTEAVVATPFADELRGSGAFNHLKGMDGNDTVLGNGGNDILEGGNGHDSMAGGNAGDTIFGGAGNDTISGLGGDDILKGDGGNDSVLAGQGHDSVYGGTGDDTLKGDDGNDVIYGETGNDAIYAGTGANLLVGGSGSDYFQATNGGWFDTIYGDNTDGSGAAGWTDVADIDMVWMNNSFFSDAPIGVEAVV